MTCGSGSCVQQLIPAIFRTCLFAGIKRVSDCFHNPVTLCRQSAFQTRPSVCENQAVCGIAYSLVWNRSMEAARKTKFFRRLKGKKETLRAELHSHNKCNARQRARQTHYVQTMPCLMLSCIHYWLIPLGSDSWIDSYLVVVNLWFTATIIVIKGWITSSLKPFGSS